MLIICDIKDFNLVYCLRCVLHGMCDTRDIGLVHCVRCVLLYFDIICDTEILYIVFVVPLHDLILSMT